MCARSTERRPKQTTCEPVTNHSTHSDYAEALLGVIPRWVSFLFLFSPLLPTLLAVHPTAPKSAALAPRNQRPEGRLTSYRPVHRASQRDVLSVLCIREASFRLEPRRSAGIAAVVATLEEDLSVPPTSAIRFQFSTDAVLSSYSAGEQGSTQ